MTAKAHKFVPATADGPSSDLVNPLLTDMYQVSYNINIHYSRTSFLYSTNLSPCRLIYSLRFPWPMRIGRIRSMNNTQFLIYISARLHSRGSSPSSPGWRRYVLYSENISSAPLSLFLVYFFFQVLRFVQTYSFSEPQISYLKTLMPLAEPGFWGTYCATLEGYSENSLISFVSFFQTG